MPDAAPPRVHLNAVLALVSDPERAERLRAVWNEADGPPGSLRFRSVDDTTSAERNVDAILIDAEELLDTVPDRSVANLGAIGKQLTLMLELLRRRYERAAIVALVEGSDPDLDAYLLAVGIAHVIDWRGIDAASLRRDLALVVRCVDSERRREQLEARLQDWLTATSDWFWELGPDLSFKHLSGRLSELTGLDLEQVLHLGAGSPVAGSRSGQSHGEALRRHQPFQDYLHATEDRSGRRRWLKVSGKPFFDVEGRFLGYRGTSVDVTEETEARRRAEEAQALLRDALENMPLSLALFDADDRLVLYNQRFLDEFGVERDLARLGVPMCELLAERVRRGHYPQALGDEQAWIEARLRAWRDPHWSEDRLTKDGRWIEVTHHATSAGGVISVRADVTESRNHERELTASEARFRAIFEHNLYGVAALDEDGAVMEANPACLRLFECPAPAALVGRKLADFVEGHYRSTLRDAAHRAVEGESQVHAFEMRTDAGNLRWLEMGVTPVPLGANGAGLLCVLRDLSEVRADQLRMARMLRILDESTNEVYLFDAQRMRFEQVNRRARTNLGYSLDELLEMTPADVTPQYSARDWTALVRPLVAGDTQELRLETEFRRRDGSRYPVEAFLRLSREGTPMFVAIVLDVSERKRAQENLLQAQKLEAVGQLASGVAHDFNNVLTVIGGNLRLLAREMALTAGDGDWGELLQDALGATQRAGDLTRSLLSISRKDGVELSQVDVAEVVDEAGKLLRRTLPSSVNVSAYTDACTRPAYSNRSFMHTALLNLGLNARDAMPQGGELILEAADVDLDAQRARRLAVRPGPYVCVAARDSGTGMDDAVRARIFEPLYSTKPAGKGSGLGLTMVQGFVLDCGGAIDVQSQPGAGTSISLYLPVFALDGAQRGRPAGQSAWGYQVSGTLLVVDDDEQLRTLVARGLSDLGAALLEAANADAALRLLGAREGVDAVIADIQMDGRLDGIGLMTWLLEHGTASAVILMSGDEEALARARERAPAGIVLLRKPFTIEELVEALPPRLVRRQPGSDDD